MKRYSIQVSKPSDIDFRLSVLIFDTVRICRVVYKIAHGMSSVESSEHTAINIKGWKILDVKFADDNDLILAMSTDCEWRLKKTSKCQNY